MENERTNQKREEVKNISTDNVSKNPVNDNIVEIKGDFMKENMEKLFNIRF